jgi:hypothetical protein
MIAAPARNMAYVYSLDLERGLFIRVVLVRRWDPIGSAAGRGRTSTSGWQGVHGTP